ncbi:CD22 protein, partial [Atractosteus spatula]|nr:CD22 protein [Atractosteus spatula]
MWCFKDKMCFTDSFVYHSGQGTIASEFIKRAEYLGDKHKNCTLNIKVTRTTDQGTYRFRFIVNHNKWTGVSGVALSVKELQVKVNSSGENNTVREGDRVTLICENRNCTSTQTELIWFKNGQPLSNTQTTANTLFFNPVSSESSGNYACALRNYPNSISQHIIMDVRYAPKNTTVSISPSGEIVKGSSVTLTCNSNANPHVKSYTWFKSNGAAVWKKGSGQSLNITEVTSEDSGWYYCQAQNEIGVHNSTAVALEAQGKIPPFKSKIANEHNSEKKSN